MGRLSLTFQDLTQETQFRLFDIVEEELRDEDEEALEKEAKELDMDLGDLLREKADSILVGLTIVAEW